MSGFHKGKMLQTATLVNVEIFCGLPDEDLEIAAGFCREDSLPDGVSLCKDQARTDKLWSEAMASPLKDFVGYYSGY